MAVAIRQATVRDIPQLAYFLMEATGGFMEALYHGVIPDKPTYQIIEHFFSHAGTTDSFDNWWVAEQEGEIVGGVSAHPAGALAQDPPDPLIPEERLYLLKPFRQLLGQLRAEGSYYIRAVAAYPEYRGAGIGSALISHAHSEGKARGFIETSLLVFSENTRAVELYKRLGYTEVARRPVIRHELIRYGSDVLLMVRPLQ